MIDKIKYVNERGQSITLDHNGPLFLYEPKGFHGMDADPITTQTLYQDGSTVHSVILKERVLTLNCYIFVDTEAQREKLKRDLYKAFNPKLSGTMMIYKETCQRKASNLRVIQAPEFKDDYSTLNQLVEFQIQLLMPYPYFEAENEIRTDFGNDIGNFFFDLEIEEEGKELSIRNNSIVADIKNQGESPTPIRVVFRARSRVKNPSIYNVYTKEYIKINKTMDPGEEITVTTHRGKKRVTSKLNGVTKNIFNLLDFRSTFMWLEEGDNIIRYDAEELLEQLEVFIYHTEYFLGV